MPPVPGGVRGFGAACLVGLLVLGSAWAAPAPGPGSRWLAGQAGLEAQDLPASVMVERTELRGGRLVTTVREEPLEAVAARMQAMGSPPPPGHDAFLGAGVRGVSGDGVRWMGFAGGQTFPPYAMTCMQFQGTWLGTPPLTPPGGPMWAQVHVELPKYRTIGFSLAQMDLRLLPAGVPGPAALRADSVDFHVWTGEALFECFGFFGILFSLALLRGDGTIQG